MSCVGRKWLNRIGIASYNCMSARQAERVLDLHQGMKSMGIICLQGTREGMDAEAVRESRVAGYVRLTAG